MNKNWKCVKSNYLGKEVLEIPVFVILIVDCALFCVFW